MTAIVSRERAKATALTGAAGVLLLMAAFVMMFAAAPKQAQHRPAAPPVTQLTTDLCRQLTPGNAPTSARACLAGPSAPSAWAEPYPPGRGSRLPAAAR